MMQRGTGPITQTLIAINAGIWVIVFVTGGARSPIAIIMALIYQAVLQGWVWQLFTSMFLHIDPFHIFFNMFALWQYGSLNERLYSRNQFLIIYLGAGLIGNIASLLVYVLAPGGLGVLLVGEASLGASGAIFGLIGSFVAYARGTRAYGTALFNAILVFAISSFAIGIVNAIAHLFGLLGGYLLARYFIKPVQSANTVQYQVVGPPPEYPWR